MEEISIRSCQTGNSKIAVFQMMMRESGQQTRGYLLAQAVFVACAVLVYFSSTAWAQSGQAVISGVVTDPSGASVPHAAVAIKIRTPMWSST
jgi:hypothetical protein